MSAIVHGDDGTDVDVLIVGGGLVGASLACALEETISQHGLRVALVEAHDIDAPRERPPSFDDRSSALSWGTRCIYQKLGLWCSLEPYAEAIQQVHVSDRGHFGVTRLRASEEDVPALGYVVSNHVLGDVLLERLRQYRREQYLQVYSPERVESIKPFSGGMTVQLGQQTLRASLVVLADGGRSGLMKQLGISHKVTDYQQQAIIANLRMDQPHHGIAYERFVGEGAKALLPLQENHYALVWTLNNDRFDEIWSLSDTEFLERIQQSFGGRVGRFIAVGKRDHYPLSMRIASEQVRPSLAILGNAAHGIHPVAGQGYNLAIRGAVALAQTIHSSFITGEPVRQLRSLLDFQEKQARDQALVTKGCDGLIKLFARSDKASILARNLGLSALGACRSVKSVFTRKAMGL